MRPSRLLGVMSSVGGVPVCGVRMVGGFLVAPGVVVFASFCVVSSSMCGVFCCLVVMFSGFLGHKLLLSPALSSPPKALFDICTDESSQYPELNVAPQSTVAHSDHLALILASSAPSACLRQPRTGLAFVTMIEPGSKSARWPDRPQTGRASLSTSRNMIRQDISQASISASSACWASSSLRPSATTTSSQS